MAQNLRELIGQTASLSGSVRQDSAAIHHLMAGITDNLHEQTRRAEEINGEIDHLAETVSHISVRSDHAAEQASEAAAAQGYFWEMHDQLFTHLPEWSTLLPEQFRPVLSQYAAAIGLDVTRFDSELDAGIYAPIVDAALQDAAELQIVGVPMLLYNGVPFSGRDDLFGLDEAVRLALLEKRFFPNAPDITIDPAKNYRATIVTEKGNIVIDLFPRDALVTVNNFIFLAQNGWYDDITFHYVVPGYLAQTGDPSNTGRGGPGYTIPDEHNNGLTFDREGLVAMAHPLGIANSAGSEFFITLAPLRPAYEWDGQYTIFGIVVEGMDIVRNLTPRNANDPIRFPDPPPGDRVITITIEEVQP
jgi:cyclophilin family peptidyl-prolyl cis-trans isomerase/predicted DsbA family dithiol-disulfide isomerase